MTTGNPYLIPVKPEKDDYSTLKGDSRHWAGGKYTEYAALLADYEGQLEKHRLWHEGNVAAKAEQTEIVSELVTALSFYLVDWSVDETIHQATIDFAIAAQEKARKATQ